MFVFIIIPFITFKIFQRRNKNTIFLISQETFKIFFLLKKLITAEDQVLKISEIKINWLMFYRFDHENIEFFSMFLFNVSMFFKSSFYSPQNYSIERR